MKDTEIPDSLPVDPARQIVHDLLTHAGEVATSGGQPQTSVVAPLVTKMVDGGPEMQAGVVWVLTEYLARLIVTIAEEVDDMTPEVIVAALIHQDWTHAS